MASSSTARSGVLLIALGTPAAPTPTAIRQFLQPFLCDPRVIEAPRALWLPVVYGIILPLRPRRLVSAYQSIWTERGSPLLVISEDQREALQARLGDEVPVMLAMRYGEPSIRSALDAFAAQQVERLIVLPMYPQYSATTTASAYDGLFAELADDRRMPALTTLTEYATHPAYIAALADSVREHWATQGRAEHLMMSFHSIPQSYVDRGDPYGAQCQLTADALAAALALTPDQWSIAFQSRVGRMPWLQPYTDERISSLAKAGMKTLDVICPGFAADCLETLEEIAQRYAALFVEGGGQALRYIPALNTRSAHIDLLESLVRAQLST